MIYIQIHCISDNKARALSNAFVRNWYNKASNSVHLTRAWRQWRQKNEKIVSVYIQSFYVQNAVTFCDSWNDDLTMGLIWKFGRLNLMQQNTIWLTRNGHFYVTKSGICILALEMVKKYKILGAYLANFVNYLHRCHVKNRKSFCHIAAYYYAAFI